MTPEEAITILKIAKTEVEWNYPLDYAIAIDTAIEALERYRRNRLLNLGLLQYVRHVGKNCQ